MSETALQLLDRIKAQQKKRRRGSNPESSRTTAIVAALVASGFKAYRQNAGTIKIKDRLFKGAPTGSLDVVLLLPPRGRHCEFEVKRPGKALRKTQREWGAFLEAIGGRWARVEGPGEALRVAREWAEEELAVSCSVAAMRRRWDSGRRER